MNCIDKGLIAMRIAYHTKNEQALRTVLQDLVKYGCSKAELFENCTSIEMRLYIRALLAQMQLKPITIR